MKLITTLWMTLGLGLLTVSVHASDPLAGTKWVTFDESGKKKAVVHFQQQGKVLKGSIIEMLSKQSMNQCTLCKGKYHNKSLIGVEVIPALPIDVEKDGHYEDGTIYDPKKDKSYQLKASLKGNKLEVRGFKGFSMLGRTQTWTKLD